MNGNWSLAQACKYLSVSAEELNDLYKHKLVVLQTTIGGKIYSRISVQIARHLLQIGKERAWSYKTLGCYADLVFATEVGRAVLLPMGGAGSLQGATSWLETRYAAAVLRDLGDSIESYDGVLVALLRSVVTVGSQQFWKNRTAFKASAIFPIVKYFEDQNIPILGQGAAVARDAGLIFSTVLLAFANVAPPISSLFRDMSTQTFGRVGIQPEVGVSLEEQALILYESHVAVDKLYASKATEIHSSAHFEKIGKGIMRAQQRTIALELKTPAETPQEVIDNIIDLVGPYLGVFGSRVLRALYEVSNDEPYWRNPVIDISSNDLLDRLGLKRDKRGYHWSENRERLRDALAAAHNLEIVGEIESLEDGIQVRKGFRRTVLSLIGATFDAEETQGMSMADLFQNGLPKSMQIRLNFFDGIRRPDGRLGNSYVLMPRLAAPEELIAANYTATEERLKAYFLLQLRQTEERILTITRKVALEQAGINTRNVTRATQILTRALDKLIEEGTLKSYSGVPLKPDMSFKLVFLG